MVSENEWHGRLVVRLLPQHVNGDYEAAKRSRSRLLPPMSASTTVPRRSDRTKFNPCWIQEWKLSDCACVAMDVRAANGSSVDDSDEVHIHLNRSPDEGVHVSFQRLGLSLLKKISKKSRGLQGTNDIQFSLRRSNTNEEVLYLAKSHFQVWTQALQECLEVHILLNNIRIQLQIDCCPPTIVASKTFEAFQSQVFVGVPLLVTAQSLFAQHVLVDWYVDGELVLKESTAYVPKSEDIGKLIMVALTPSRQDCASCPDIYQFTNKVRERPRNAILELRHKFCQFPNQIGRFRVMSYNILADTYASSAMARMQYSYCDKTFILKQHRFPLLLFEILEYKADVICLQEVDQDVFHGLLNPILEHLGYEGFFTPKERRLEGPATFWSLSVFQSLSEKDRKHHVIRDLFAMHSYLHDWSSIPTVLELLDHLPDLHDVLRHRLGHVLQTVTLTTRHGNRRIVVGNTHLVANGMASHLRLLQLFMCLHQMEIERRGVYPIVFCGDLNSSPTSGAAKLLFDRIVSPSSGMTDQGTTWKHLYTFSWDNGCKDISLVPRDAPNPPTIQLPNSFPLLSSGYPELPSFTHYLPNFAATLDYILFSRGALKSISSAAIPPEEVLKENVAMPSIVLPSDHISLVCDLEWIG